MMISNTEKCRAVKARQRAATSPCPYAANADTIDLTGIDFAAVARPVEGGAIYLGADEEMPDAEFVVIMPNANRAAVQNVDETPTVDESDPPGDAVLITDRFWGNQPIKPHNKEREGKNDNGKQSPWTEQDFRIAEHHILAFRIAGVLSAIHSRHLCVVIGGAGSRMYDGLCILDLNLAVDLASDRLIAPERSVVPLPMNINDSDVSFGSTEIILPQDRWTDMSFSLTLHEISMRAHRAHAINSELWEQRQEVIHTLDEKRQQCI
ncbi:hypothetical protein LTR95_009943 [Oleoguttula sp. CCFEE 5521]